MSLIVQKYGGSSVADADSIERVASKIAQAKEAGNDVVVTASPATPTSRERQQSQFRCYNGWAIGAGSTWHQF